MSPTEAISRLREVICRQHKAIATEDCYVYWLRQYMSALETMPASLSSEQKLERFLTYLAAERDVAASTQNQAFNAIIFFYKDVLGQPLKEVDALRATRPAHLRHAPTRSETRELLLAVRDGAGYPTNLISRMLYGCGLRVTENWQSVREPIKWPNRPLYASLLRSDLNAVGLDLVVKSLPADAEALGGFQFVPACFLQHLHDGIPLHTFKEGKIRILRFITHHAHLGD